jgi:hypothetical protein
MKTLLSTVALAGLLIACNSTSSNVTDSSMQVEPSECSMESCADMDAAECAEMKASCDGAAKADCDGAAKADCDKAAAESCSEEAKVCPVTGTPIN